MSKQKFFSNPIVFLLGLSIGLILRNPVERAIHLDASKISSHSAFNEARARSLPVVAQVIERGGYTVCYDGRSRNLHYVIETITRESFQGRANRAHHSFREDEAIPAHIRATLLDYRGSSYDRGHLSPAVHHKKSNALMAESFILSNICPQNPQFNRGYWAAFEKHVRDLTQVFDRVQVTTGPLYLPRGEQGNRFVMYPVIGENDVAVPTHFYKVLRLEQGNEMEERAYIMPNEYIAPETPLEAFQATVQKVERLSGILFKPIKF